MCVRGRLNILVSGGTGSGKTTLLNILSSFIPTDERIVTIEDAVELRLRQPHVIRLESRPANVEGKGAVLIRDLVRNSLRMRPDRVVIGECRGGETLDMLQAMNTGHDGSLSTLHANSPRDALSRIETMVLMAGMDLPVRAIREQVASAVDLIVHTSRLRDGSRRVTHLSEVVGMEGDTITMNDVFVLQGVRRDRRARSLHRHDQADRHPSAVRRSARRARHPRARGDLRRDLRSASRQQPIRAEAGGWLRVLGAVVFVLGGAADVLAVPASREAPAGGRRQGRPRRRQDARRSPTTEPQGYVARSAVGPGDDRSSAT